jgi:Ca-activated chloride channel homolog
VRKQIILMGSLVVVVLALMGALVHFEWIRFTSWPYLLLLPPLYGFALWLHTHSFTDMSPARSRASITSRLVLITLLTFALAGFEVIRKGDSLAVVFVVDSSRSIRDDQKEIIRKYIDDASKTMRTVDKVGIITFAQDPHTQSAPGQPLDPSRIRDQGSTSSTDIEQALRSARSELDSAGKGSGKRIVLITDGNETTGRALAEVPELAADHIVLDTVTVKNTIQKEALVEKLVMPARVKIGEPFSVRAVISSLTAQTAKVALFRDGKPTGVMRSVSLRPGKNVVVFDENVDKPGSTRYSVTLDAPDDTIAENNKGEGLVQVQGKPAILYVADSPALTGFIQNALRGENIEVQYCTPEALPGSAAELQRFDSIILSNVRASDLSGSQMVALQVSCRDFGVGFGMIGGENSFGAGGWRGTPMEDALPVTMDVKIDKRLPSVAVALVIEDLEIPTTVNMSIEAAKATMDLLEPIDQVGVLDCNGAGGFSFGGGQDSPGGTWRIPMQHVTDREALKSAMQNLQNMGDPPSYTPFLLEAARVLNGTDAKVKHIVFLGDGDAVNEQSQGTIAATLQRIRSQGITISTIATGANGGDDIKFMATLAYLGGGQAYVAERPQDLPRLLLKDQMTVSQPPIIEEPFRASPVEGEEVFKGIDWNSAPPLLGYNVSNLKNTAELSLMSHRKDPVFAGWRYGLGRSIAFLSDDRARWAAQWLGWPGYAKFWAQAVRYTLRPFAPSDYSTQVSMDGGRGHIVVDALDQQGHYVNKLQLTARVASPTTGGLKGPAADELCVRQTGPGHYEGWFDAPQTGTYLVNVVQRDADGRQRNTVLGLSTAYSPEYRTTQPNTALLSQLAQSGSGRTDPAPSAVFGVDRPGVLSPSDMIPKLLFLAMLLLPIDIAIRRLSLDAEDMQRLLKRSKAPSKSGSAAPELSRLRSVKQNVAAERLDRGTTDTAENSTAPAQTKPVTPKAPVQARTLRPEPELRQSASVEAAPPPPVVEVQDSVATEAEDGMSRLMAAKMRARQKQEKRDDE